VRSTANGAAYAAHALWAAAGGADAAGGTASLTGEGGGEWTVDLTSDPPVCDQGDKGTAQCTIELSHEDFKSLFSDPQAGMQLYFQGKLKVTGDPMLATRLQQVFELAAS
jgi:hypothetical protein